MNFLRLTEAQVATLYAHAQSVAPAECCGLLGGVNDTVHTVYQLTNSAAQPLVEYAAAPAELFQAQRQMRERGETLLGIYHSHPRQAAPVPSASDVRQAFYPSAVYFIIGLGGAAPILRAFWLDAAAQSYERVRYHVAEAWAEVRRKSG